MSNVLYAVGTQSTRFYTNSVLVSTTDSVNWTTSSSEIFPTHEPVTSISIGSGNSIVAVSSIGQSAMTLDSGSTWTYYPLNIDYNFATLCSRRITGLSVNPCYVACGFQKYMDPYGPYLAGSEVAQIYIAADQTDYLGWTLVFSHASPNSIFYKVIGVESYGVFAVGSADGRAILWTSTDGQNWSEIQVPYDLFAIYDITLSADGQYLIMSSVGSILKIDFSYNWTITYIDKPTVPITNVSSKNHQTSYVSPQDSISVATSSQSIYYTIDGAIWSKYQNPGYSFGSVIWFEGQWYVAAYSNLNQWTYWTSSDAVNWISSNNKIHVSDFSIL